MEYAWIIFQKICEEIGFNISNFDASNSSTYPMWNNESLVGLPSRGDHLFIAEDYSFNPNVTLPSGLDEYEPLSFPRVFFIIQQKYWFKWLFYCF